MGLPTKPFRRKNTTTQHKTPGWVSSQEGWTAAKLAEHMQTYLEKKAADSESEAGENHFETQGADLLLQAWPNLSQQTGNTTKRTRLC